MRAINIVTPQRVLESRINREMIEQDIPGWLFEVKQI